MLVLSRGEQEKFIFANLGVTVQILRVSGKRVRVGVEAPPEIRVLREELVDEQTAGASLQTLAKRKLSHRTRNRLNTATLALHLLQKQLEAGLIRSADATIEKALCELESLDQEIGQDLGQPSPAAHPRRALLVEDNSNESELLAGYLRMSGYEVDTVADGLAAIAYLRDHARPDVVLLDMMMPRLDGAKTVTSIRCDPRLEGIRVFAVSGSDRRSMGVEIGPRGVDRWFCKPINPRDFVAELDKDLSPATVQA